MAVKLAKLKGAGKVLLTARSHSRARVALGSKLGADRVVAVDKEDLVRAVREGFPEGVERVFVTAPPEMLPGAFEIARFGATIVHNGISFADSVISFDANAFHFKRLQLHATHSIPNLRFPLALDLVKDGVVNEEDFVSHTFPFAHLAEAMRVAESNKANAVKVMVVMK